MTATFLIKHRSGGKYFHPDGGETCPKENTNIVLCGDIHERMYWTFEQVIDHWGYIKHVSSGKIIHPDGGSLDPEDGTGLVLSADRHWGALFAIDEINNYIIHKGGQIAGPKGDKANPNDQTQIVLNGAKTNDAIRFQFISTNDPNKEVRVYDKPTAIGKWKIIYMVLNPIAEHSQTIQTKVGRSETESTTSDFKYKWEMSAGALLEILSVSFKDSLDFTLSTMSSTTWSTENTIQRTIKVSPGKSVVTWQFVLAVSQNDTKSVFQSDRFADTESPNEEPKALMPAENNANNMGLYREKRILEDSELEVKQTNEVASPAKKMKGNAETNSKKMTSTNRNRKKNFDQTGLQEGMEVLAKWVEKNNTSWLDAIITKVMTSGKIRVRYCNDNTEFDVNRSWIQVQ